MMMMRTMMIRKVDVRGIIVNMITTTMKAMTVMMMMTSIMSITRRRAMKKKILITRANTTIITMTIELMCLCETKMMNRTGATLLKCYFSMKLNKSSKANLYSIKICRTTFY